MLFHIRNFEIHQRGYLLPLQYRYKKLQVYKAIWAAFYIELLNFF
ncbi:hypothetical protein BMG_4000 [Priestia megaterium]|nr:hypothetical protein BMG_4000 [Priestia megaterium]